MKKNKRKSRLAKLHQCRIDVNPIDKLHTKQTTPDDLALSTMPAPFQLSMVASGKSVKTS